MSSVDVADSCWLKDTGKVLKIQIKFCHDDRAWCMLINRWGRKYACCWREKKENAWVTETCQAALTEISKSHKVCATTQEPKIACGICYKRFDLKHIAFDIKEEKLGQFSICCGSKQDLWQGRGGKLCLCDTYGEFLRTFSVWVCLSLFHPSKNTSHRMLNLHHKRAWTVWATKGVTDDQTDTPDQIYQASISNRTDSERWTRHRL